MYNWQTMSKVWIMLIWLLLRTLKIYSCLELEPIITSSCFTSSIDKSISCIIYQQIDKPRYTTYPCQLSMHHFTWRYEGTSWHLSPCNYKFHIYDYKPSGIAFPFHTQVSFTTIQCSTLAVSWSWHLFHESCSNKWEHDGSSMMWTHTSAILGQAH